MGEKVLEGVIEEWQRIAEAPLRLEVANGRGGVGVGAGCGRVEDVPGGAVVEVRPDRVVVEDPRLAPLMPIPVLAVPAALF